MNSYRDYTWDVVRGIGILMVVLGHCAPRPLVDFVYLFHMGLFFFVSAQAQDRSAIGCQVQTLIIYT